jgi:ubiquinone/menaquinone biosynthesis C-methylase UbiE
MALNIPAIIDEALNQIKTLLPSLEGNHLDIGAGEGDLIKRLKELGSFKSYVCDYTDELIKTGDKVDVVDLNTDKLPYPDDYFDLVTCTEVIEHIEHYRETLREINRVLKPGGYAIISTPNILNLKSRIRFLFYGFYNLFGPLHIKESKMYSTGGHINPVSVFYLVHSLLDADFIDIKLSIDKKQNSSQFYAILLYPLIRLYCYFANKKERVRYKTIDDNNVEYVHMVNSYRILVGRTIVVSARKNKI